MLVFKEKGEILQKILQSILSIQVELVLVKNSPADSLNELDIIETFIHMSCFEIGAYSLKRDMHLLSLFFKHS